MPDIRTAAQREAESTVYDGTVKTCNQQERSSRVTPTREQIKAAATKAWNGWWNEDGEKSYQDAMADAFEVLMQELAEGKS